MNLPVLFLIAGLPLVSTLAAADATHTYPGYGANVSEMPLLMPVNRHLVASRSTPVCKFMAAPKHPIGRVSVGQKIEALIRLGKKTEAIDLIDASVEDGTCYMSKPNTEFHVTGMLMASDCNGVAEKRSNVEEGIGVFSTCFYLPIVEIENVEYTTLSGSLRNFEGYAIGYLHAALMRKGLVPLKQMP